MPRASALLGDAPTAKVAMRDVWDTTLFAEWDTPPAPPAPALDLLTWTQEHRRLTGGKVLDPAELPWLRALYQATAPELYVMKASQVFVSEWLVSTALWAADTGHAGRGNVLYVFPTQTQLDDFSQARVDTAIEASPYLLQRVSQARQGGGKTAVERVRLKRVGQAHVYFRGSDNRRQIISIDADVLLLDELDEYKAGTVAVARERLSSSLAPLIRGASTPKYPASGMGLLWQDTTRRRYLLPCPACGRRQPLTFPENLTEAGQLVCQHCAAALDVRATGEWVAEAPDAASEGYHVNRLYSPRADLVRMAQTGYAIAAGLVSDPSVVQEFHNQALGQPYAPAGGSLTDDVLLACLADYGLPQPGGPGVVMGVDVGAVLHVWIKGPVTPAGDAPATRALYLATVPDFEALDGLMARFDVSYCVIDAEPEGHETAKFAKRWPGRVARCFFPNTSQWQHEEAVVWKPEEAAVQAHRTRALDATFDRFRQRLEALPREAPYLPGLFAQLKAPVRILTEDSAGRTVARYDEGSAADHYAFAALYAWVASLRPHKRVLGVL